MRKSPLSYLSNNFDQLGYSNIKYPENYQSFDSIYANLNINHPEEQLLPQNNTQQGSHIDPVFFQFSTKFQADQRIL